MKPSRIRLNSAPILAIFVTLGMSLTSSNAFAACEDLSVDSRFQQLRENHTDNKELTVGITHLMSEAFTPYLKEIYNYVTQIPQSTIRKYADQVDIELTGNYGRVPFVATRYDGRLECFGPSTLSRDFEVPYTKFNRAAMRKLLLAVCIAARIVVEGSFATDDGIKGSKELLFHTYAQNGLDRHLYFAFLTLLQSGAQLTSDPVLGFSDEEILRSSMQQSGARPGLMVLHSLILPPDVIGPNGSSHYIPNSIQSDKKGEFSFSLTYKEFIKRQRRLFEERKPKFNEFGHGCPVGHCLSGEQRSGLQYFLDAALYVYDQLGDDRP